MYKLPNIDLKSPGNWLALSAMGVAVLWLAADIWFTVWFSIETYIRSDEPLGALIPAYFIIVIMFAYGALPPAGLILAARKLFLEVTTKSIKRTVGLLATMLGILIYFPISVTAGNVMPPTGSCVAPIPFFFPASLSVFIVTPIYVRTCTYIAGKENLSGNGTHDFIGKTWITSNSYLLMFAAIELINFLGIANYLDSYNESTRYVLASILILIAIGSGVVFRIFASRLLTPREPKAA